MCQVLASGVSTDKAASELPEGKLRRMLLDKPEAWDLAKVTQEWCHKNGAQIIYPGHAFYPERFGDLPQPPNFLSVSGEFAWQIPLGLGIVGGREPTVQAVKWMEEHFLSALRRRQLFTVSGGARGIDQAAHRLSLRAGRPTIAFIPSGLAQIYPADFRYWRDSIVDSGGAIVSEYAPNELLGSGNFHRRNRMIAALSNSLFVVEAARKSGSLITARYALELGRSLCALPASALEPRAMGTLDLLYDGASLIRDADDLLRFLGEPLAPSFSEGNDSGCEEDGVRNPHGNDRRQLTLTSHVFGGDVHHPVSDDQRNTENHSA